MLQQRSVPQSSCQSRRKDLNARSPVLRSRSSLATPARPSRGHKQRFVCFKSNNSEPTATLTSTLPSSIKQKKQALTVSWAGAGVFFFWQLGAMKYLAEKYDLTKVPMVGASGGSLAAVLAACGVNADCVIQKAYDLSVQYNIWERPLGLLGIWGSIIEKWLDELLPDNAHELCRNRITVVVTTLPDMAQIGVSDFRDKQDLINACMASSHVPFFLDLKLTRTWRGKRCVDGSFPDFFTGLNSELLRNPDGGQAIVFDYFDDTKLQRKGRMDMLEVKTYDEIRRMMQLGYQYAHQLHADGKFDHYELAEVLLQGQHGHMSEVLVPEHSHSQPSGVMSSAKSSSSKSPMGLVLELEQSEAELVEQIKGAAHQQQVPCKMQAQTA